MRPSVLADARLSLEYITQLLEASAAADWPTFLKAAPDTKWIDKTQHPFATVMVGSQRLVAQQHYRLVADRRMAAVALAVRCYQLDNAGKAPARLSDLVPKYLKAVPLDPMATDQPLCYKGGDKPIVYSVGEDGKDDGGSELDSKGQPSENRWRAVDAVVRLYRTPRKP